MIAWISQNSNDHEHRAISDNIFGQCGKIAASNIYQARDQPYYRVGNSALIAIATANAFIAIATKVWYTYSNRKRTLKLQNMTPEEYEDYKLQPRISEITGLILSFTHEFPGNLKFAGFFPGVK
ncbi:hypothetical protein V1525DRAFT_74778 [Lipomyces kononenkoae]|uniref:Uncharacterized protein n=1 Tax=Lipomyces kononenkoae TaxID=34357 RepID=A0ACC3T4J9_LIPKO